MAPRSVAALVPEAPLDVKVVWVDVADRLGQVGDQRVPHVGGNSRLRKLSSKRQKGRIFVLLVLTFDF